MDRLSSSIAALLALPVRLYRRGLSPLLPRACRFHPSCSAYALEALGRHGPLRGSALVMSRLTRCHPWNAGGIDPVPELSSGFSSPSSPTRARCAAGGS